MFGTYLPSDVAIQSREDHPAIVYPLAFAPRDEFNAADVEAIAQMVETGESVSPWGEFERDLADLINAACGFRLQDRCDRIRRAMRESF